MTDFLRRGKRGYIIAVICVLFLGMCCENTQADSALMYGIIHHTDSVLKDRKQAQRSDLFYAENRADLLCTGTVFRQESRQISSKGVRETVSLFLVIDLFFKMIPAFFSAACAGFHNRASDSNRIVCYIHLKDGKKSDSLHTALMTGKSM